MQKPNIVLLYVDDPSRSVKFYERLLGEGPIENSPTFAMFKLNEAMMLGLWIKSGVEPKPDVSAGAAEIGIHLDNEQSLRSTYADWQTQGTPIAQEPTRMDLGLTFVGLDPDGHRLRVFCD
jgi:predicted enzyme related to lactoylglutathione lyase